MYNMFMNLAATVGPMMSPTIVMTLITAVASPLITQLLKKYHPLADTMATTVNQAIATGLMVAAWFLLDRNGDITVWLKASGVAGAVGAVGYNVTKTAVKTSGDADAKE